MLPLKEANEEESVKFSWGRKSRTVVPSKDVSVYDSFTYDGVDYFLYDCVYMWDDGQPEPYIGKLVRIWESATHKKRVKVVWFFRPTEIQNWLGDVKPLENEIFLASGEGVGLSNINTLETIAGKCDVVCTSKDKRNPQPSKEEVGVADFVFFRTFDVGSCRISDNFVDIIDRIEVKYFFNWKNNQKFGTRSEQVKLEKIGKPSVPALKNTVKNESKIPAASSGKQTLCSFDGKAAVRPISSSGKDGEGTARVSYSQVENRAKLKFSEELSHTHASDVPPLKKRKLQDSSVGFKEDRAKLVASKEDHAKLSEPLRSSMDYKAKRFDSKVPASENRCKAAVQVEQNKSVKADSQIVDVTRRPDTDTRKWFKQQSWEEKMQRAHEKGTLVFLENLDPSYTSIEVEDIVWHAFKTQVDAKMLQRSTFSSPHYGQAFVIFKSKDAADSAIFELNRKCLMLTNGRPVVGRRGTLKDPGQSSKFFGHLIIDKGRFRKQRDEMRTAVSTSHYSQSNTIEYEMAIEWRALEEKSEKWWEALNEASANTMGFDLLACSLKVSLNYKISLPSSQIKQQAKEIEDLSSKLKMRHYK